MFNSVYEVEEWDCAICKCLSNILLKDIMRLYVLI